MQESKFDSPAQLLANNDEMSLDYSIVEIQKPHFKIGRSLEVDLCLMDVNISRLHCEFTWNKELGWALTDYSSNGVSIGSERVQKGTKTKIEEGDVVILSDLPKRYSWKFHLENVSVESESPLSKRRKLSKDMAKDRRDEIFRTLDERKKVAEIRLLREKIILENAVKMGQERQSALIAEKNLLISRLEEQTKRQAKRDLEVREKMEKELKDRDDRNVQICELEEKMKYERSLEEEKNKKLLENMESRIREEEENRKHEVKERDEKLLRLNLEKDVLEKKFEKEREIMDMELKDLQSKLLAENSSKEVKDKEWQDKLKSLTNEMEERLMKEKLDMDSAIKKEKEEREKLAKEIEKERLLKEEEMREQEKKLENERATYNDMLEKLKKEKEIKEEELKLKNEEWEKSKNKLLKSEEEMISRLQEMERKKELMERQIQEERDGKAATEEESKERAARISALENEIDAFNQEKNAITLKNDTSLLHSKLEETLESQYQCPTCLELFICPVALNCGHTFCWLCLAQWKGSSGRTRGDLGTCPTCRAVVQHENRVFAIDHMIDAIIEQLGGEKKKERLEKINERKEEEEKFKATATVAAVNTANRGSGSRGRAVPVRGRVFSSRGRQSVGRGGTSSSSTGNNRNPVSIPIEISSSEEEEDSSRSSQRSSSDDSSSRTDGASQSDSEVPGLPGYIYRGFGRCFKCDRRGHWAPGCPF